ATAQSYMKCLWGTPVAPRYATTSCAMNYLLQGTPNPTGISAVAIQGGGYGGSNDAKGIDIPAALNADPNRPPVAQFSLPNNVDATRAARRQRMTNAINSGILAARPDDVAKAWDRAWADAY